MKCLDSILGPLSPPLLALVFALAGCSDDGLAPADTDAAGSTGGGTSAATTGDTNPATTNAGESSTGIGPGDSSGGPSTGTEGTTGESDTTGEPTANTCEDPRECVLVNDCCQCAAVHMDEEIPECALECDQPTCDALGIPDVGLVCEDGECGLEPHDCSGNVSCDSLPPECPADTLPEVGPGDGGIGGCWTGACIPVAACDPVPGCEYCDADEACVLDVTQVGPTYSCRAMPEACAGVPTCACMPPDTCEAPFDFCAEGDGVIQCECPAC